MRHLLLCSFQQKHFSSLDVQMPRSVQTTRNIHHTAKRAVNGWNSVFKKQDDDPWSEVNFGSMRAASSMHPIQQHNEQIEHGNVHLKSSFNVINTLSVHHTNSNAPSNRFPAPPPQQKRRTVYTKRKTVTSKSSTSVGRKQRPRKRKQQGAALRARPSEMKEIRKYQKSTELLLNKTAFGRVVREIAMGYKHDLRFTKQALKALQQVSEWYLVGTLRDANLCAMNATRSRIECKDLQLARRLRDPKELQHTF